MQYNGNQDKVGRCSNCVGSLAEYCAGCTTDWPFAGSTWYNLCTQKVQMMMKLAMTTPGATASNTAQGDTKTMMKR